MAGAGTGPKLDGTRSFAPHFTVDKMYDIFILYSNSLKGLPVVWSCDTLKGTLSKTIFSCYKYMYQRFPGIKTYLTQYATLIK